MSALPQFQYCYAVARTYYHGGECNTHGSSTRDSVHVGLELIPEWIYSRAHNQWLNVTGAQIVSSVFFDELERETFKIDLETQMTGYVALPCVQPSMLFRQLETVSRELIAPV